MTGMTIMMAIVIPTQGDQMATFYRVGPHSDLVVMGIYIDTIHKYMATVFYCIFNIVIRNLNHNIIIPWITHNIQDTSTEATHQKATLNLRHVYEVALISTLYTWFDWLVYINMLLSQIDFVLIELGTDLFVAGLIVTWYMRSAIEM
jgi:hypothetical protein